MRDAFPHGDEECCCGGLAGGSREAIDGDLSDQLRGLADEPGVRYTL